MNNNIKQALMKNWGERAESMQCYAEVKYILPNQKWSCYVYALDPNDEDTIKCLVPSCSDVAVEWCLTGLLNTFDHHGEYVQVDHDYRKKNVAVLYKKLIENHRK